MIIILKSFLYCSIPELFIVLEKCQMEPIAAQIKTKVKITRYASKCNCKKQAKQTEKSSCLSRFIQNNSNNKMIFESLAWDPQKMLWSICTVSSLCWCCWTQQVLQSAVSFHLPSDVTAVTGDITCRWGHLSPVRTAVRASWTREAYTWKRHRRHRPAETRHVY